MVVVVGDAKSAGRANSSFGARAGGGGGSLMAQNETPGGLELPTPRPTSGTRSPTWFAKVMYPDGLNERCRVHPDRPLLGQANR